MLCVVTIMSAVRQGGWTADASTFGARLALVRQRMGWGNVKEAAEACGIPAENWRRWERDGREPHRITAIARQISTATGCDYLWLLVGPEGGSMPATHAYTGSDEHVTSATVSAIRSGPPTRRDRTRPAGTTPKLTSRRPAMIPRPLTA
jgi:hypothetical protein